MVIYEDSEYKVVHSWSKEAVQFWEKGAVISNKPAPTFNTCTSAIDGPEGFSGDNFYNYYSSKNIFQIIKKSETDENGFPLFFDQANDTPNNLMTLLFSNEGKFIDDVSASVNASDKDIDEYEVKDIVGKKKYKKIKKAIYGRISLIKIDENRIGAKLFESIDLDIIVEFMKTAVKPEVLTKNFISLFIDHFKNFVDSNDIDKYKTKDEIILVMEEAVKNAEERINTINFFQDQLWDTRKYNYTNHLKVLNNMDLKDFFKVKGNDVFREYLSTGLNRDKEFNINVVSNKTTMFIKYANNVGVSITREIIEEILIKKMKEVSPKVYFERGLFKIREKSFTETAYTDLQMNEEDKIKEEIEKTLIYMK